MNIFFLYYNFFSVNDTENLQHGGCLYNGDSQVLYWADVSSEIAFVVPTINNSRKHLSQSHNEYNISHSSETSGLYYLLHYSIFLCELFI